MPVTLAIDGWSTLTNKLVLGVCFLCQGTPYLITTLSNTGESQTAEYLENTFREHIELIEAELNVKITSVVTSQHGIDETQIFRRSYLWLSCTHGKSAAEGYFTTERNERTKNLGRQPIPCETRWNSHVNTVDHCLKNWAQIADIINTSTESSETVYRDMEDTRLKVSSNQSSVCYQQHDTWN